MNGAQTLLRTLADHGVDTCFMNPGTSELHFVAALDDVSSMRGVLALFEGVATGAADGYARMAGRPAAVLLHLGPGLGNGLANLHNARRAGVPVVVIVGDHAIDHVALDAPLQSDIETVARNVSAWVHRCEHPNEVAGATRAAIAAAMGPPAGVATLIVPASVGWGEVTASATAPTSAERDVSAAAAATTVADLAEALRTASTPALLLGGMALADEQTARAAAAVAHATGARFFTTTFPTRHRRGAGLPAPERLGYFAERAEAQLEGVDLLVTVNAPAPVSFFGQPGRPGRLAPPGCRVVSLADTPVEARLALTALAGALGTAPSDGPVSSPARPPTPSGAITPATFAAALGAVLPEDAIVVDESNTSGLACGAVMAGAPVHDWLFLTGGAIGYALPAAVGAAIACPERRVICLESDGSAMYNVQALWTMARQRLDVTTVVLDNGAYRILEIEMSRLAIGEAGPRSRAMFSLGDPDLDFVRLAEGFGVPAVRAASAEALVGALGTAVTTAGPRLIHAVLR